MSSTLTVIMEINNGIWLQKLSEGCSTAFADSKFFTYPENIEDLVKEDDNYLYFAGGSDFEFTPLEIEIWGLVM